ncbi:glycoside hydrolase family 1 protein [Nocardioides guangzhouensis]|uniref:Glycoside hydrolase family 1 protein n=1 Tax=Nocardioides guangzhouensis TaxID=2497878 RepID=A0A4Q4Z9X3_9ACTN|nr:family 1 glycosylhydrolase [Nocardioides guangzhouensis]RYP84011.1 glycoside hydrolase family 1 protein [Nocardioides guangzhouensis]
MSDRSFPTGFLWGVAGSGHQTEGDNIDSDTWFAEQVTPTVFREPSGRACGSYERWREDVALAAGMGLSAYRFSVEWARVEPHAGTFSEEALDHYEAVVDECLALGLAPVVTFNHFTSPHWFAKRGGWLDPEAPEAFARYCGRVMDRFGDRIAVAVTLNEPNLARLLTWLDLPEFVRDLERATLVAASEAAGVPAYRLSNVMLPEEMDAIADGMTAGHVAARAAIRRRRPDLPVGLSIAVIDDVVDGDDASVRDRKRAEVYERWLRLARDDDFVGVQNYERVHYDGFGAVPPPEGAPLNQMGTEVEPLSLAGAVRYAHEVAGVPVLVTEHGMATPDDTLRAEFIEPALAGLLDAVEDGVPVLGYLHWTLLDNFEWIFGYSFQYGLHEVDRETLTRTAKPSAGVYAAIARAGAVRSPVVAG